MKIRTRLLLFLLPTLVGGIALVSSLLSYNWYGEIVEGFQTRLKSAVVSTAALIDSDDLQEHRLSLNFLSKTLQPIKKELEISEFYFLPINSHRIASVSKDLHITPIYESAGGEKLMTGYAPIYDKFGHLMGLMAADINVNLIDEKFRETLLLIIFSSGLTILITIATLFMIANKISRPVQKLNNSALAIAAGQYGESIAPDGPREIAELANTLNTMGECLRENFNRLKENSLLRERMYGEYECAMLLQHLMLQKNIDDCRSDAVAVKAITFFSDNPRGLLLDFPKPDRPDLFHIHLAEAQEEGFEGMYQLLSQYKYSKESQDHTSLLLDRAASTLSSKGPASPILWSLEQRRFLESPSAVESGDFFFLFNQGFSRFYKDPQKISDLLAKVLKVFAQDGLETTASMLQKELAFATKRKDLEEDIHLFCFQILN
jgi:HAMP domain-containing protein